MSSMRWVEKMDKFVSIQLNGRRGTYATDLAAQIQKMITTGLLSPGYRLPPIRKLASMLSINNVTVITAYKQLEAQGLVYTKPGSGTYCMPLNRYITNTSLTDKDHIQEKALINSPLKLFNPGGPTHMINLADNSPMTELFPLEEFRSAINEILDLDGGKAFAYHESAGYSPLRKLLCDLSESHYRICCSQESLLVTSGAQQAMDLIAKVLIHPGDTIMAENPSYIGLRSVLAMHGARILGIPLDMEGVHTGIIESYARRYNPRLLYTMPVYQTPTGISLSMERRETLLRLAEKYNFYIIEDDLVSDINLVGARIQPLKSMDKSNRVIYIKSFSKLLMPGIRIGFMIAPPALIDRIIDAKAASDLSSSGFFQRALMVFIYNGCLTRHLNRLSDSLRSMRLTAMKELNPCKELGVEYLPGHGGFGIWLTLPSQFKDKELVQRCQKHRVLVAPGQPFYVTPMADDSRHIYLNYGSTCIEQICSGIQTVKHCLADMHKKYSSNSMLSFS